MIRALMRRSPPVLAWLLATWACGSLAAARAPTTVLLATGTVVDPVATAALALLLGLRLVGWLALGPWLVGTLAVLWQHRPSARSRHVASEPPARRNPRLRLPPVGVGL